MTATIVPFRPRDPASAAALLELVQLERVMDGLKARVAELDAAARQARAARAPAVAVAKPDSLHQEPGG